MKTSLLSGPRHLQRWTSRSSGCVPPLVLMLVLVACATPAPARRDAELLPIGTCRVDEVMNELVQRYPGVRVGPRGDDVQLRVRGSLQEPLYILDGQPLAAASGVLSALNPCDIERIQVLTDPADLTFYGRRGANGVVLITTKRP